MKFDDKVENHFQTHPIINDTSSEVSYIENVNMMRYTKMNIFSFFFCLHLFSTI